MAKANKTKQITIRLTDQDCRYLHRLATARDVSVGRVVRGLIADARDAASLASAASARSKAA